MLAVAGIGAIATTDRDRVYWLGFAICRWAPYMFTLGPWTGGRVNACIFSRPILHFLCAVLKHERKEEVFGYDRILTT